MIYIQYDFKPGYLVKDEDIKNLKYCINRASIIKINNKINPLIIQELFLNYLIKREKSIKSMSVYHTIINIYKNKNKNDFNTKMF